MIWYLIIIVAGKYGHMEFSAEKSCLRAKSAVETVVEAHWQTAIAFCTTEKKYSEEVYVHGEE